MLNLTKVLAHTADGKKGLAVLVCGLLVSSNSLYAQSTNANLPTNSSKTGNKEADACIAIKDATKRANCFESVLRAQVSPSKVSPQGASQSRSASANQDLKDVIAEIKSIPVKKDEFETKSDYLRRVEGLYGKYTGQRYEVRVPCQLKDKKHKRLVSYDAENGEIVVSFPDFDSQAGFLRRNGELTIPSIKYSYFPVEETDDVIDKYRASNAFGAQIDVTKVKLKSIGAAVLYQGSDVDILSLTKLNLSPEEIVRRLPKPEEFRYKASPALAKQVLQGCTVAIQVESALSDLFELMTTGRNYVTTILLEESAETKPTLTNSIHLITVHVALPVRLLSLELLSESERITLKSYEGSLNPLGAASKTGKSVPISSQTERWVKTIAASNGCEGAARVNYRNSDGNREVFDVSCENKALEITCEFSGPVFEDEKGFPHVVVTGKSYTNQPACWQ